MFGEGRKDGIEEEDADFYVASRKNFFLTLPRHISEKLSNS
jgi:hypothetical protein